MITLDLYGAPIAQKRPRIFKNGNKMIAWDPDSKLKEGFKWQIKSQYRDEPLTCPIAMDVTFYMPIPESTSGIKKRQMVNGVIYHIKRPDIDNMEKAILDILNGIVLKDDSQIVELRAKKIYSDKPGTSIRVYPLSHEARNDIYENHHRETRQTNLPRLSP